MSVPSLKSLEVPVSTVLRRFGILVGLLAALIPSAPARADTLPGLEALPELAGLEARWAEIMDLFDTPGMAVAVVKDGAVYTCTLGIRDPGSGAPVTADTEFYIASMTKTYTAAGIHLLAAQGKLDLEDPVQKYLHDLRLPDAELQKTLTIRDLLSHRYGINSQPAVLLDAYTGEITEERYYHWLAEATIAGKVDYTNVHFTLLGRVIEAVTGVPWRGYLEANVFLPAGMTRTTGYASRMWADPDHAVPTARKGEGWEAHAQRKTDRTMHAAGGLATTARDGGQWLKLFLGGGMVDGHRVLTEETVADMLTLNGAFPEPDGTIRVIDGFGSAWQVGAFNGHRLAMHSGGYIGTWAHAAILPEDGAGVYVLINADGPAGGLGTIVAVDVLERLSGTTSPWSVYDRYIEQIRKKKAHDADAPAVVPSPGLAFDALPRPAKGYEGEYHNPWWGTVKVAGDGEYLTLHLGDYALDVSPVEGTPDHFTEDGLFDDATTGRFVAGADGTVTEVVLLDPERGEIEFKR